MTDQNTPAAEAVAEVIAEYDVLTKCLLEAVHEPRGPQVNKALDAWRQKYQGYRDASYTASCAPEVNDRVVREYQSLIDSGSRIHATMFLYGAAVALNTTIAQLLGLNIPSPRPEGDNRC